MGRIKLVSKKTAKIKRKYKQVCDEIDEEMVMEYGQIVCTSCGTPATQFNGTAHSHNLPKGTHPEFETERWNISPRCLKCHRALDDHDFEKIQHFDDLWAIMTYRREYAPGPYNRFVTGLEMVGCSKYEYVEFYK